MTQDKGCLCMLGGSKNRFYVATKRILAILKSSRCDSCNHCRIPFILGDSIYKSSTKKHYHYKCAEFLGFDV
ncbi:MAG: hypothetical protein HZA84_07150 [Thaumarchaeota archaeon]|nr:hypothetical protein [Nitrososphaerota archaeon]